MGGPRRGAGTCSSRSRSQPPTARARWSSPGSTPTGTSWRRTAGSSPRSSSTARRSARSTRAGRASRSGTNSGAVIPRIETEELHELARSWGFSVDEAEAEQLLAIAEAVFQAFDLLESQRSPSVEPVAAVREAGRPPEDGKDPFNAIVRFCRVRAEDAEGVLSGKRIAVKDAVAIAGIPLTCGSRVLQGFVPAEDSVVTDRILRAGAEIVAITNMDDMAFSGGGDSSWYGPTLNPWDSRRTAGGSSGGSAAALFYDGIDVSIGGDQGGSIRVPASWCGVIGLKPTHGLVPYVGITGIDQTFDHCGPMGRTAADVAVLLQAIAGKDDSDPRQRDVPAADYLSAVAEAPNSLSGVRFGVVEEGF